MNAFFLNLWNDLRNSLLSTFGILKPDETNTAEFFATFASEMLASALLLLLFVGVYRLLRAALRFLVRRFRLGREVSRPLAAALRYVVVLFALLAILSQWGVPANLTGHIARAAAMAFLYYLGWLVGLRAITHALARYELDPSIVQLLRNVISVVFAALGGASILSQFGVNVLSLVTGLGVVGIAVGFAAQDTLGNFIAGTTLLVERPFRIGDWVQVNEQVGKVREITLRNTRLVTRDNVYTSIPNSAVASSEILNFSAGGPLRLKVELGIAYGESVEAARAVLVPVMQQNEKIMQRPIPIVRVDELADSSVNLQLIFWIAPSEIATEPGLRAAILEASKVALDEAGIEIPFPHLQLFIDGAKALEPLLPKAGSSA